MFHDVQKRYNDPRHSKSIQGINFHELLYADDTLIMAQSFASATKYLHLVEEESDNVELNLNRQKYCYIVQLSRANSFPKWRAHEIFRGNRLNVGASRSTLTLDMK